MTASLSAWENLLIVEVEPYFSAAYDGHNSEVTLTLQGPGSPTATELPANLWDEHLSFTDLWYQDVWYAVVGPGTYSASVGGTFAGSGNAILLAFQDEGFCGSEFQNGNSTTASSSVSTCSTGGGALGIVSSMQDENFTSDLGSSPGAGTLYSNAGNSATFAEWESAPVPESSYILPAFLSPSSAWAEVAISLEACNYTITFNETGLPSGTAWDINLTGMNGSSEEASTGSTITFSVPCACNGINASNGSTYNYSVSSPPCFAASPSSGIIQVPAGLASGSEVYQPIAFSDSCLCNYTITFNESGLAPYSTWNVTVNGVTISTTIITTSNLTITFSGLCPGNYTFTVTASTGFTATPASGTLVVSAGTTVGGEVYQPIVFTTPCNYTATFNETGLPVGSIWSVTFNGTTLRGVVTSTGAGRTLTFSGVCVGYYSFKVTVPKGYTATPASGTLVVAAGTVPGSEVYRTISVENLEFHETGLANGTAWDVTITGRGVPNGTETQTTNGMLISFSVPKGKYTYLISKSCDYSATPLRGTVTVGTAVRTVAVTFAVLEKTVEFHETGLPKAAPWTVTVTGPEPTPPFSIVTTIYYSGARTTIKVPTVCGNYTWTASNSVTTGGVVVYPHPSSGVFAIQVPATSNTIQKVPAANPIAIRYTTVP